MTGSDRRRPALTAQHAQLQRDVSKAFNEARYEDALQAATTCLSTVQDHYGEKHPVTASCFNNLGLIHKVGGRVAPRC